MNTPSAPIRVQTMKLVSKYRNEHIRVGQWPTVRKSFSFTSSSKGLLCSTERNKNAPAANFGAKSPGVQFAVETTSFAHRELVCMKGTHHGLGTGRVIDSDHAFTKWSPTMRALVIRSRKLCRHGIETLRSGNRSRRNSGL